MSKAMMRTVRFAKAGTFNVEGKMFYLTYEALEESMSGAVGIPVYLEHRDKGKVVGYVSSVYRDVDEWFVAEIIITDEATKDLLNKPNYGGYMTSIGYTIKKFINGFRTDGINFDAKITGIVLDELSLTVDPRMKDSKILNSDDKLNKVVVHCDFIDNKKVAIKNNEEYNVNSINDKEEFEKMTYKLNGKEYNSDFLELAIKNHEDLLAKETEKEEIVKEDRIVNKLFEKVKNAILPQVKNSEEAKEEGDNAENLLADKESVSDSKEEVVKNDDSKEDESVKDSAEDSKEEAQEEAKADSEKVENSEEEAKEEIKEEQSAEQIKNSLAGQLGSKQGLAPVEFIEKTSVK